LYTTPSIKIKIKIKIKRKIKTIKSSSTQGSQFNDEEHEVPCMH